MEEVESDMGENNLHHRKKKMALLGAVTIICLVVLFCSKDYAKIASGKIQTGEIAVDFQQVVGQIRPLQGMNNGPASGYFLNESGDIAWQMDVTGLYKEMGIPYVRTHDTEYPYGQDLFVDIHCIFPDFRADPNLPSSYSFEETDEYIAAIIDSGAQVFFRLGESIDHSGENRYTRPPEDLQKWAEICEHIIRHYNKYWADGYSYGIEYWEIWNEPDSGSMWRGSMEEFYELYHVTASYLKQTHPEVKVGGGAFSYPEEEKITAFLGAVQENNSPLDFLSWHTYTNAPGKFAENAGKVQELLNQYGFTETENILDEWNYLDGWDDQTNAISVRNSFIGASFLAASLIEMQNSPLDLAMYYDGQYLFADFYCGLYDAEGKKEPGYYSFLFWNELNHLKNQAYAESSLDSVYCCAAVSGEEQALLVVNYNAVPTKVHIKFQESSIIEKLTSVRINGQHPESVAENSVLFFGEKTFSLEAGEILFLTFQ